MSITGLWDQLVDAVCRPPRDDAYTDADLVGGRRAAFRLYNHKYYRQDVVLTNARGQQLQASHYRPCVTTSPDGRLPCVVYLHCNSGSRRDAEEILYHLLPKGITVFAFDFAGSGLSDGGYVTLGAHEVEDLEAVVAYLREEGSTSTIGLWGRSMGAVTALLFSQRDPSVAGMVLDSPFSRLVDLMLELATEQQLRIPRPFIKMALAMLKRSVKKRAGFSVDAVAPLDAVGSAFIPALFGHARDDTFVNKHHSERLFAAYAGDKNFISFDGDHNSMRDEFWYSSALIFLLHALRVPELVGPDIDLQALPPDALPHLHPRGNSIYVTASNNLSQEVADAEAEAAAAGSGASSPRSPSSAASPGRVLRPPWALRRHSGGSTGAEAAAAGGAGQGGAAAAAVAAHSPLQGGMGGLEALGEGAAEGQQLASVLGASSPLAAELEGLQISEEEALQRALELSLADVRQSGATAAEGVQQGQQQRAVGNGTPAALGAAGGAEQPAAGAAAADGTAEEAQHMHVRYNPAFASSGSEGRRNPLYGGTSGDGAPHSTDEEEAMLAAAIAASLADSQQQQQQEGAAAGTAEAPAPSYGQQGGSDATEAAAAGEEAVPNWQSAQAVADAHSGQEAAA
ncbi:alpha beta-hydrolase [Chlorella sorokiniana]|uniref:Alpha beta-hydrolase n=1 Tax=Chlorella sorokiniana TaxID=3076 RepID=A0A2P6THK7_CHLSO|nr:alpha beta-hydrolase [Chlorella sorokiniana]|eukprot:PRW33772.1 alpha beta-hydrolase [Chlorella sorokiniana]